MIPEMNAGTTKAPSKPRASGDDPKRIVEHYWYSE